VRTEPWRPADPLSIPAEPETSRRPTAPSAPAGLDRPEPNSRRLGQVLDLVGAAWPGPRSFADLCASLPDDRMVTVGEQLVHVEQAGRGEPVVLLHGFGCSSYTWRLVIPALARRFRVIAPDLNGFGWTQRPREAGAYTLEGQEATLLGVLEALGVEDFHLVGHSYGGGLAIWLASRQARRVRSLALVSSVLPAYTRQQRQAWARFRGLNWLLVHFFVLSRAAIRRGLELCFHDRSLVTPELVDAYRGRLLVEGVEDAYYGLMAPVDLPAPEVDLSSLRVPTLLVWGDNDRVAPLTEVEPYVAQFGDARLVVLPACGHAPMEERPRELLAHLLPFLGRHRRGWRQRLTRWMGFAAAARRPAPSPHPVSM
jgi:pimeloyl-ACP methyl ester carboxylesterase